MNHFNFELDVELRTERLPPDFFFPTADSRNKTILVSIDAYDWNFARISWNTVKIGGNRVTYRATCKAGSDVIEMVTSNTSILFFGLKQLTPYTITVQAQRNNGTLPFLSSEVHLTTLG